MSKMTIDERLKYWVELLEHRVDLLEHWDEKERVKIRGIGAEGGLDFIWMDEFNAFSADDFEEAMARLRGKTKRRPSKNI